MGCVGMSGWGVVREGVERQGGWVGSGRLG